MTPFFLLLLIDCDDLSCLLPQNRNRCNSKIDAFAEQYLEGIVRKHFPTAAVFQLCIFSVLCSSVSMNPSQECLLLLLSMNAYTLTSFSNLPIIYETSSLFSECREARKEHSLPLSWYRHSTSPGSVLSLLYKYVEGQDFPGQLAAPMNALGHTVSAGLHSCPVNSASAMHGRRGGIKSLSTFCLKFTL